MFLCEGVLMRLFLGCFFIIRLLFSRKSGWFIRCHHWFGWYLPYSWTRWFIRTCFKRVILGRGFRRHNNCILCHMETFLFPHCTHMDTFFFPHFINTDTSFFPHCIIMTQCVFLLFLILVYHLHHIRNFWMLIFVRVKLTSQRNDRIFPYNPLLKTHSN